MANLELDFGELLPLVADYNGGWSTFEFKITYDYTNFSPGSNTPPEIRTIESGVIPISSLPLEKNSGDFLMNFSSHNIDTQGVTTLTNTSPASIFRLKPVWQIGQNTGTQAGEVPKINTDTEKAIDILDSISQDLRSFDFFDIECKPLLGGSSVFTNNYGILDGSFFITQFQFGYFDFFNADYSRNNTLSENKYLQLKLGSGPLVNNDHIDETFIEISEGFTTQTLTITPTEVTSFQSWSGTVDVTIETTLI